MLGWRWVFGLTAPVAPATAIAAPRVPPETAADGVLRQLDVGGAVLVTAASLACLFGITRVESHGIASAPTLGPLTRPKESCPGALVVRVQGWGVNFQTSCRLGVGRRV
jgi:hypothetical protein